uniref:Uncharacterized protein n=1 Tax=Manihot esculenta TaxID=3983 RepID=A0A2C9VNV2_MANES
MYITISSLPEHHDSNRLLSCYMNCDLEAILCCLH